MEFSGAPKVRFVPARAQEVTQRCGLSQDTLWGSQVSQDSAGTTARVLSQGLVTKPEKLRTSSELLISN